MKLFILKPIQRWCPWYDKMNGFVIRAEDETHARLMASGMAGDEGSCVWLAPDITSCRELTTEGKIGLILYDFSAG